MTKNELKNDQKRSKTIKNDQKKIKNDQKRSKKIKND